jgi:hypothetical protein
MKTDAHTIQSKHAFDEDSKRQLDFVREQYGSLSRFLNRKKHDSACVAIYGRSNHITTNGDDADRDEQTGG